MADDSQKCAAHEMLIKQEAAARELLEAQIAEWQAEVSEQLEKISHALIGDVDSSEPGMKELLRLTYNQAIKTNGRVNGHDTDIKGINDRIGKVWYAVWGGFVTVTTLVTVLAWGWEKGFIKFGG